MVRPGTSVLGKVITGMMCLLIITIGGGAKEAFGIEKELYCALPYELNGEDVGSLRFAVDETNNIYICKSFGDAVEVYDASGKTKKSIKLDEEVLVSQLFATEDDILIASSNGHKLYRVSNDGVLSEIAFHGDVFDLGFVDGKLINYRSGRTYWENGKMKKRGYIGLFKKYHFEWKNDQYLLTSESGLKNPRVIEGYEFFCLRGVDSKGNIWMMYRKFDNVETNGIVQYTTENVMIDGTTMGVKGVFRIENVFLNSDTNSFYSLEYDGGLKIFKWVYE